MPIRGDCGDAGPARSPRQPVGSGEDGGARISLRRFAARRKWPVGGALQLRHAVGLAMPCRFRIRRSAEKQTCFSQPQNGLEGDRSGEMSVSNALTALTRHNQPSRAGGKYRTA
jgi:hypothetical protein